VSADEVPPAKLLLVDDRPENLLALSAVLEPLGQELVMARSGPEALKHLLTQEFAVILMDVQMPGMDGFETAELIKQRERTRHIPIIFVTALNRDERFIFQGYQSGAVDYLSKPIDPDMLRSKVTVFVDLWRQRQKLARQAEELHRAELREVEQRRQEAERAREQVFTAELAAREAELRQFKATLDATLDAVFLFDPETLQFVYVNQGAVSLLGYSQEEFARMTPLDLDVDGGPDALRRTIEPLRRLSDAKAAMTYETRVRRKRGEPVQVEVVTQYVAPPEGGARFVSIVRDITERKRAERELALLYEREKKIAETLQQSIVQAPPEDLFPGLSIDTFYQAAWEEANVGGDYLDVFALERGRVALVVGDVSGKGLSAAARTAEVKYALRAFLRENADPALALGRLNALLCGASRFNGLESTDMIGIGSFICLATAVMEPATGEVIFGLAGCEPPLIVRKSGKTESVPASGMPLGIDPDATHANAVMKLAKGDMVMMVTDGITEARAGREFFGYEGFVEAAKNAAAHGELGHIGRAILEAARNFTGGKLQDDACLLLASRR
jgi:PAS domain S-box-containing protein